MAILLAYSKISLFEELIDSNVPEDPYLQRELLAYFPQPLGKSFAKEMQAHPLRREIIATYITNSMLNRMGSVFAIRMGEDTGERASSIARAYSAARELWDARRLWNSIDSLDNQVPADVQIRMHIKTRHLLERASRWLLRNRRPPLDVETLVKQFAAGIAALRTALPNLLPATEGEKFQRASQEFSEAGVPQELAQWIASLEMMYSALDLVEVAIQMALPVENVAAIHFALVDRLELNWLQENIIALPVTTHWQQRAQAALIDGFYTQARALTADVLRLTAREDPPEARLTAWLEQNRRGVGRCLGLFADLRSSAGQPDLAMLSVALRETANLLQSSGS
jgi:glutamate dehydrogenase